MGNIFVEKSYKKCGRETIPRPFSKKAKLSISVLHIQLDVHLTALRLSNVNIYCFYLIRACVVVAERYTLCCLS